jgi:hypothetical protein
MSLPGSRLNAIKSVAPKPGTAKPNALRSTSAPRVTVLQTPTKVLKPAAPNLTTLSPIAMPAKNTVISSGASPVKPARKTTHDFKRPDAFPRPVEKPEDSPVDKPVKKSVENSRKLSVMLDKDPGDAKPLKKYTIAKKKVWAGLAFAGFVVAITGFLVYLNLPDISVRVRATELGISTNLPAYKPEGYNVQGIATIENDILSVKYASSDDSYVFTARKSSLDPYQMADYAKSIFKEPESVFEGGLTIYVRGADAIWANGGVLYTISGSNALTKQQIAKIAMATE